MRMRKLISKNDSKPVMLGRDVPSIPLVPSIPMLPFILTYLDLSEWVNMLTVNHYWQTLLFKQCQEIQHLNILPYLGTLHASQEPLLQPLDIIFKALASKPTHLQAQLLKATIFNLQNSITFIPTQHLLFPFDPIRLHAAEIVPEEKKEYPVEDVVFFNYLVREFLSLYSNLSKLTLSKDFQKLFLTKLKEKYLQTKYSIRDKPTTTENNFSEEINIAINISAKDAHDDADRTARRLPVVHITAYTLFTLNFILTMYRVFSSPRDVKSTMYQAMGLSLLSLVVVGGVKVFHENKRDLRRLQGDRLTLFSKQREHEQVERITELTTLVSNSDAVKIQRLQ